VSIIKKIVDALSESDKAIFFACILPPELSAIFWTESKVVGFGSNAVIIAFGKTLANSKESLPSLLQISQISYTQIDLSKLFIIFLILM
jgi:hypothetical protein